MTRWYACRGPIGSYIHQRGDVISIIREDMGGETVTGDWKEVYLIKLPKEGDLSKCSNYRGSHFCPSMKNAEPGHPEPQ